MPKVLWVYPDVVRKLGEKIHDMAVKTMTRGFFINIGNLERDCYRYYGE